MTKSEVINWYNVAKIKDERDNDPSYKQTYIKSNSLISIVGPSGSGKTNALLTYIKLTNGKFNEIIIFSGGSTEEPLYKYLESHMDGVELIDDVNKLPKLEDLDITDTYPKLIVFDDWINLDNKHKKIIQHWFNAGRKYHYTIINLSQNIVDIPLQIRRNTNVWILFKLHDMNSIKHILKTSNVANIPMEKLTTMYLKAVAKPLNFFIIRMNNNDHTRYSHNFTDFYY
jgi:hypothetical protein